MVAIADMEAGRAERERMVTLALERGWIQKVVATETAKGITDAVAVLATHDATPGGAFGDLVRSAVVRLGHYHTLPREQRAAGLHPYVVFPVPLALLCQLVDPAAANDLRDALARNEYAVLCMNADREVLISGVSPIGKDG
jgi:hypothetical protein